jgi:ABC-type Mn2+/Zn2+ transport system permease subunit
MLSWLTDPFGGALMQRALAEVLILAVACGPLGVWVLLYRQSYAAESISHAMLPGLVIAALVGLPLVLGALGGVLAAAAAIALAGRDERLGGDVGVAVAISALFGLGAMLALSPEVPPRLGELLFGDLLGVDASDLLEAAALAGAVALALALGHRRLAVSIFDRAAARSLGARPAHWELVLLALLAVCTVAAVRGLGNLLVVALILAPGAAALNLARRLPAALALSVALAAVAGVLGLVVSYHWEVAAGASVALAAVVLFLITLAIPQRRAQRPAPA